MKNTTTNRKPKRLRRFAAHGYAAVTHACSVCGWKWHSENKKDAVKVETAAKVNGDGPYCVLCLHLEMAARYASARGYHEVRVVMDE